MLRILVFTVLVFIPYPSHSWFFSSGTLETCLSDYKKDCQGNPFCISASYTGCNTLYSKQPLSREIGNCILKRVETLKGLGGISALINGCTWNEKCGVFGQGMIGDCLLNKFDSIYSNSEYDFEIRRCYLIKQRADAQAPRLGLETKKSKKTECN